jgi:hypothetical protein
MAEPMESSETGTSAVAVYAATMSADLAAMARRTGLETLSYLLEMVRLEAENVVHHDNDVEWPPPEADQVTLLP